MTHGAAEIRRLKAGSIDAQLNAHRLALVAKLESETVRRESAEQLAIKAGWLVPDEAWQAAYREHVERFRATFPGPYPPESPDPPKETV